MSKERAIVILSGGLDSTVALYLAREKYEIPLALTFDYGQRAVEQERKAAQAICHLFDISHKFLDLTWLGTITKTALVNSEHLLPALKMAELDNPELGLKSAKAVWVPNRNGVFINIAAAFAEAESIKILITGFNAEEAATFPDNSLDYVKAVNHALDYSTSNQCRVESPTIGWDKTQIVKEAAELKVPFEKLWSCYESGEKMCGKCESCLRSKRAYLANGLIEKCQALFVSI